jgi:nitrogenase subunit NifH
MLRADQQEAEEGGPEKGIACWGAGTLHQVKMVSHPNYLLPRGPSAQGLPSQ